MLLLNANEIVPADRLIDALWDGRPPRSANKLLQTYVSQLRKELGSERIVTRSPGYRLSIAPGELDVERFEQAADPHQALALWRGAPLADFEYDAWAQPEIARLTEAHLARLEERIELDLARGRHEELVAELDALVAVHPLRERLREQLMLALYRCRRQADALATYREARQLLVEELGIEPSRPLQMLERAILRQDPELDVSPAPRIDAQRLIGRDAALREIAAVLETSRLVTLVGPGGIGKTRLALEVPNAVVVELAALSDPGLVAAEIARTLGVSEQSLHEYLSTRELRLVLDNFEQIAAAAPLLDELLAAAPRLSLLVTSRVPLHLATETRYQVPPLATDDGVALFVERARESRPDFEPLDLDAIEALCARLDGLPLALELAAARAALLSPRAILARLGRRLDLLRAAGEGVPDRHRTLRAAVEWSYDLLNEDQRALFSTLAVFSGGFSADAVEAVVGSDALDDLSSLIDSSLVRTERPVGDEPRFGMLETIREYALDRLAASGALEEARDQHLERYLTLAETAEPELTRAGQAVWLERLTEENDNIRAALVWSFESGKLDIGLRLAGALVRYWSIRGLMTEGRRWLGDALEAATGVTPAILSKGYYAAGFAALGQGDYVQAKAHFEEGLALAREAGDIRLEAQSLQQIGWIVMTRGRYEDAHNERAVELATKALELSQQIGEKMVQSGALNILAEVAAEGGDEDKERSLYEQSLALRRELGDRRLIANSVLMLGNADLIRGDYDRATPLLQEGLSLAKELRDTWTMSLALIYLGRVALQGNGDVDEATALFGEALALAKERGDKRVAAECLQGLAAALGVRGESELAARLFGASEALLDSIGATPSAAELATSERFVPFARDPLGDAQFEHERAAGAALSADDAIGLALGNVSAAP